MKRLKIISLLAVMAIIVSAQPPEAFKYQAVVRNADGNLVAEQNISFRTSIRDGSPTGAILFQETHLALTNLFGLANLLIGEGTPVSGNFSTIDWSAGDRYLEVECDPAGGTGFVEMGTAKLHSVPYALFANRSNDSFWELNGNKIFYNNGYVGIETNNPLADLHVFGTGLFQGAEAGMVISPGANTAVIGYSSPTYGSNRITLSEFGTKFTGTVCIGSSDPSFSKLQIEGSSTYSGVIRMINTGTDGASFFLGATNDSWSSGGYQFIMGHGIPGSNNADITIDADGKIGIGETTPAYRLHVKGPDHNSWLAGFHNTNTSSTANGLVIRADGGDPLLVQNSSGTIINAKQNQFVGIHTSTPSTNLVVKSSGYTHGLHVLASDDDLIFRVRQNSDGSGTGYLYDATGTPQLQLSPVGISYFNGGKVGIGTDIPTTTLEVWTETSETAIHGFSSDGTGVWGNSITSYGIFGQSTTGWAGYFSGNVYVSGTLTKGAGSFVIDHPLDPENKLLRHNFVESPENLVIYRGKAELNANGEAVVEMPDYFKALTKEDEASIHLTPVGKPFPTGAEWNRDFSGIIIYGDPNREIFWEVLADRDDPVIHELSKPVEEEKGGDNTLCEKGKLLYPKAYGYPESSGRDYEMTKLKTNTK